MIGSVTMETIKTALYHNNKTAGKVSSVFGILAVSLTNDNASTDCNVFSYCLFDLGELSVCWSLIHSTFVLIRVAKVGISPHPCKYTTGITPQ